MIRKTIQETKGRVFLFFFIHALMQQKKYYIVCIGLVIFVTSTYLIPVVIQPRSGGVREIPKVDPLRLDMIMQHTHTHTRLNKTGIKLRSNISPNFMI